MLSLAVFLCILYNVIYFKKSITDTKNLDFDFICLYNNGKLNIYERRYYAYHLRED